MPRTPEIEKRCQQMHGMEFCKWVDMHRGSKDTLRTMAAKLQTSHVQLIHVMKRNGIKWEDQQEKARRAFHVVVDGISDTKKGHCERAGFHPGAVRNVMALHGLTWLEAFRVMQGRAKWREGRDARRAA